MKMFSFSKETLQLLHKAGWDENRKDTIVSEYLKALECEGFHVSEAVKEFLYYFGGLFIKHPHAKIKEKFDYFHFDVIKALKSGDTSWVLEEYSSRVGKELCIIGEAFRRSLILCMSPDRCVYAGIDEALFFVGNSGDSAIETLCHGYDLQEISEQYDDLSIFISIAIANAGAISKDLKESFETILSQNVPQKNLYEFVNSHITDNSSIGYKAAALDYTILIHDFDIIKDIANTLWKAYESLIKPQEKTEPNIDLYIVIGELGKNFQDFFIRSYVNNCKNAKDFIDMFIKLTQTQYHSKIRV